MDQLSGDREPKARRLGARGIYDSLREQIRTGVYEHGSKLPSSRALAAELGVSRATVSLAYDQLAAEGYISVRQGARPTASTQRPAAKEQTRTSITAKPVRLSAFGRRIDENQTWPEFTPKQLVADFRYGSLSPDDFPIQAWKRAMSAAVSQKPGRLAYHDPSGSFRLRAALQGYLWRARTVQCDIDQIVIVNGSQQGLDLCARIFLDEGDKVIIEEPGYRMARHAFASVGAIPVPVPVDCEGIQSSRIGKTDARFAYVTPSHQFPMGGVMSVARRQILLDWARTYQAYVIEDDYDSEYRYDISPVPPVYQLEEQNSVIYLGTISKILSPTLRIGYLVVPHGLKNVFVRTKQLVDRHTSLSEQDALATLIETGAYERHVRKVRRLNRARRETLLNCLRKHFDDDVQIEGADAGLHLVAWFHRLIQSEEKQLVDAAQRLGIGIYPIAALYEKKSVLNDAAPLGLVLGYSALRHAQIEKGIALLRQAVSDVLSTRSVPGPVT